MVPVANLSVPVAGPAAGGASSQTLFRTRAMDLHAIDDLVIYTHTHTDTKTHTEKYARTGTAADGEKHVSLSIAKNATSESFANTGEVRKLRPVSVFPAPNGIPILLGSTSRAVPSASRGSEDDVNNPIKSTPDAAGMNTSVSCEIGAKLTTAAEFKLEPLIWDQNKGRNGDLTDLGMVFVPSDERPDSIVCFAAETPPRGRRFTPQKKIALSQTAGLQ